MSDRYYGPHMIECLNKSDEAGSCLCAEIPRLVVALDEVERPMTPDLIAEVQREVEEIASAFPSTVVRGHTRRPEVGSVTQRRTCGPEYSSWFDAR